MIKPQKPRRWQCRTPSREGPGTTEAAGAAQRSTLPWRETNRLYQARRARRAPRLQEPPIPGPGR